MDEAGHGGQVRLRSPPAAARQSAPPPESGRSPRQHGHLVRQLHIQPHLASPNHPVDHTTVKQVRRACSRSYQGVALRRFPRPASGGLLPVACGDGAFGGVRRAARFGEVGAGPGSSRLDRRDVPAHRHHRIGNRIHAHALPGQPRRLRRGRTGRRRPADRWPGRGGRCRERRGRGAGRVGDAAAPTGAALRFAEVRCSDLAEHRRRVEDREPEMPGHGVPTWEQVLRRRYEPWPPELSCW